MLNHNRSVNPEKTMTRTVTLTGTPTKDTIVPPKTATEVTISCSTEVTYFEESATYVEDGITYGAGYPSNHQSQPIGPGAFYLTGTAGATVYLLFSCGRK